MMATEKAILDALLELDTAVRAMPIANPTPNLVPIFERIDALARQLAPATNPELLHFLHRKSYEKARLLLQGSADQAPRGQCAR